MKNAACRRAAGLVAFALLALPAGAEVRLPAILSDHMVLQRAAQVPVWGWATPGEGVSVRFGNQARSTVAGSEVVVSSPRVGEPKSVRFGWHEAATPNLVNRAGLPAVPFRSEHPIPKNPPSL